MAGSTLQFLQFWFQNVVNILFLVVKSLEVTSGFTSKLMKKIAPLKYLTFKCKNKDISNIWTSPRILGVSKDAPLFTKPGFGGFVL